MLKKQISKKKSLLQQQPSFEYIDVKGDGNCLFRALSVCLYGSEKQHHALRVKACEQMAVNEQFFRPQIYPQLLLRRNQEVIADTPLLEQYITTMMNDGVHGGQLELQALAQCEDLHILLHGGRANKPISLNDGGGNTVHLKLLKNDQYKEGHYMAMKKLF